MISHRRANISIQQELEAWKSEKVTKVIMDLYKQRLYTLSETLQAEAGKDSLQDRFHCGYIAAIKDFLNVDVDEVE